MSNHLGLTVARMHGVLVARPNSPVFHVYAGPLTPAGRTPRCARPVCNARTRPSTILRRCGVTVDVHGRRMCARCSARLSAIAHRAEQPPSNHDQRKVFWEDTGVTSTDLVIALALAATVEETHAIGNVTNLLHGPVNTTVARRPVTSGKAQGRYDFEVELLRRRGQLRADARTPEEIEAAEQKRDLDATRAEQIRVQRRKDDARDQAIDRRQKGRWLMPHQRALLDSA